MSGVATVLEGGCECGAVRYRVEGPFLYAGNCHCSRCRAGTGSAFKPFAGIERDKVAVTDGPDRLMEVGGHDNSHIRCASVVRDGEYVHVAMGSLQSDPGISPRIHIHVASKAPWHQITDDLPQFQELPD